MKKALAPPHRKGSIVFDCLLACDCVIRRASRIGGPKGVRSALDEDRDAGIVDSDDLIVVALDHFQAVASIPDEAVRRVVSLAMTTTTGCRKLYNQRALEQKLGIARTTLRRMLDVGLAHVALELDRMQDAKQAA